MRLARRQPADCPRYVLRDSDRSMATDRDLATMEDRFSVWPNGFAFEASADDSEATLALLKENGRYLIDAQAIQRAGWLRVDCIELGWPPSACGCMYDHARMATLRRDGNHRPARLEQVDLQRALRACA